MYLESQIVVFEIQIKQCKLDKNTYKNTYPLTKLSGKNSNEKRNIISCPEK